MRGRLFDQGLERTGYRVGQVTHGRRVLSRALEQLVRNALLVWLELAMAEHGGVGKGALVVEEPFLEVRRHG